MKFQTNGNIASACTTLQCRRGFKEKIALRWIDLHGFRAEYTFGDLEEKSNRFANLLTALGVGKGDVFFTLLPRRPEQVFALLGALKTQALCGTLLAHFGDHSLFERLRAAKAVGVITNRILYGKLQRIKERLPSLRFVLLVDGEGDCGGVQSYQRGMAEASPHYQVLPTSPDTPSLLHFASGSTGRPRSVLLTHGASEMLKDSAQRVFCLKGDDVYWCTADQGWASGTSYGVFAPWTLGVTQVHYGGGYDGKAWMDLLQRERISIWYTSPTALRMLMRDERLCAGGDFAALRTIHTVGEPLGAEVISWSRRVLGREVYDTWFQPETGAITIANRPKIPIRPGSMGKPLDGVEAAILADDGTALPEGAEGNLCLKPGSPTMFVSCLDDDDAYRSSFRHGWYYTGDLARKDGDGYYWFTGRSDDMINSAGHLICPLEVENALLEVEEVAESGVIGAPDHLLFQKVVAFVQLHRGYLPSKEVEMKIRLHVAERASSLATPQEIVFCHAIPRNKSGKIMRALLKARYLGTASSSPPGDLAAEGEVSPFSSSSARD